MPSSQSRSTVVTGGGVGTTSITAQLERFDGGSGSYTITNGVTFRPGDLTTVMLTAKQLRVFVGGVEQAIYVEALDGRHSDTSVKVALIQFIKTFTTPQAAEIRLGEVRQTTDISKQTLNDAPEALIFPTSPTFLCAAQPFWRPLIPMSSRPTGTYWDIWENRYRSNSPYNTEGPEPAWADAIAAGSNRQDEIYGSASYQWGRHMYEFFCMTGEGKFLYRAIRGASFFLIDYARPNNWGLPEQHIGNFVDALVHYWGTGVTSSRDAPLTAYANAGILFNISDEEMADRTFIYNHGRMAYDKLAPLVIGHHLGLSSVPSWESGAATWAAKALLMVEATLTQQFSDGHNTWPDEAGHQQNWQCFERCAAMVMYYEWVAPDSRIPGHVLSAYNYINDNWWFTTPQHAWSLEDDVASTVAAELNGFGLEVLAWLYRRNGGAAYTTRGDSAMDGIANEAFWPAAGNNPKFIGEINWGVMPYIAARQGA